jgi:hypothetical protein
VLCTLALLRLTNWHVSIATSVLGKRWDRTVSMATGDPALGLSSCQDRPETPVSSRYRAIGLKKISDARACRLVKAVLPTPVNSHPLVRQVEAIYTELGRKVRCLLSSQGRESQAIQAALMALGAMITIAGCGVAGVSALPLGNRQRRRSMCKHLVPYEAASCFQL